VSRSSTPIERARGEDVATTPLSADATAFAALDEAARAIAGVRAIDEVLQLIVDRVRDLVDASYAALGIVDAEGRIERFITTGISPDARLAIGPPPHGRGLLGLIIREGRSYRIPSIQQHPDSSGFPPNHPPMTSFLGVPVRAHGTSIGNLYLTDKRGAAEFSADDQMIVETFALHAGIAIDNARLHAQAGRLAVADERERIGRDLHDGIIQSLYAVALSLEDVPALIAEAPAEGERRVDQAIDSLNLAIRDIRNFIHGLRPEAVDGTQVLAGIAALAHNIGEGGLLDVVIELDPAADPALTPEEGIQLLSLVREALSNAARHSGGRRIEVVLRRAEEGSLLEIADDGAGFDPDQATRAGHHGLANMRVRANAIGGTLEIVSEPGRAAGTRVRIRLPKRGPR
jgi:signal transduction histidine kinase